MSTTTGKTIKVVVKDFDGWKTEIDLCNSEGEMRNITVLNLKDMVTKRHPQYAARTYDRLTIGLRLENRLLRDFARLPECGIRHMSVIDITYQLFVRTLTGRKMMVEQPYKNMTVKELKASIQEQEGIPIDLQGLNLDGKQLEDDHTLRSYGIQHGSTISTLFQMVFMKTLKGKTFMMQLISENMTVKDLKTMIAERHGILIVHQSLIFEGRQLEDKHTLCSYGIQCGSTIFLLLQKMPKIIVKALITKKTSIQLSDENMTVKDLKVLIQKQEGIPIDRQRISQSDKLEDDVKLLSLGAHLSFDLIHTLERVWEIEQEDQRENILGIEVGGIGDWKSRYVFMKTLKVNELKEWIEEQEGIPIDQQILFWPFEDGNRRSDYGMYRIHLRFSLEEQENQGENISVTEMCGVGDRKSRNMPKLFVNTLTGKLVEIELPDENMTVEGLKGQIQKKEGIPPDEQRVIFNGKQLEDGRFLCGYRIGCMDIVHLVLRLRGGYLTLYLNEITENSGKGDMGDREGRNISMERLANFVTPSTKCTIQ